VAVDDGEYAVGVSCLAAAVVGGTSSAGSIGAVAVVSAPSDVGRTAVRRTLLAGAERVSHALALGASLS
jgi:DNA-binding IclR family transcriptional regulator